MYIKPLATPVVRLSILSTLSTAQNYLRTFFGISSASLNIPLYLPLSLCKSVV